MNKRQIIEYLKSHQNSEYRRHIRNEENTLCISCIRTGCKAYLQAEHPDVNIVDMLPCSMVRRGIPPQNSVYAVKEYSVNSDSIDWKIQIHECPHYKKDPYLNVKKGKNSIENLNLYRVPVAMYDIKTRQFIKAFKTIAEATRFLREIRSNQTYKATQSIFIACANVERNSQKHDGKALGYLWRFVPESGEILQIVHK